MVLTPERRPAPRQSESRPAGGGALLGQPQRRRRSARHAGDVTGPLAAVPVPQRGGGPRIRMPTGRRTGRSGLRARRKRLRLARGCSGLRCIDRRRGTRGAAHGGRQRVVLRGRVEAAGTAHRSGPGAPVEVPLIVGTPGVRRTTPGPVTCCSLQRSSSCPHVHAGAMLAQMGALVRSRSPEWGFRVLPAGRNGGVRR